MNNELQQHVKKMNSLYLSELYTSEYQFMASDIKAFKAGELSPLTKTARLAWIAKAQQRVSDLALCLAAFGNGKICEMNFTDLYIRAELLQYVDRNPWVEGLRYAQSTLEVAVDSSRIG